MSLLKKILLAVVIGFAAIQIIRPDRNNDGQISTDYISKVINVPDSVHAILKNSCFDCHSNNTDYPWYSHIQPVGWFLARHITHGKGELNFSEFGTYTQKRQYSKLEEIGMVIREDMMPLPSYRILHKDARLPDEEKAMLIKWAEISKNNLSASNTESMDTSFLVIE